MATLSHRFKSSPAIPGKLAVPGTAGYMMKAGHFRKSHVSSGDLNRPRESRGSQPSACFCGTFCTPQKVPIRFPFGKLRGSANLEAAHPNNNFPLTKLNPFQKGVPRFSKPRISAHKQNFAQCQLNPFAAPRPFRRLWRHPSSG